MGFKKYHILDEEGYTWIVGDGVWSHRKCAIDDRDWNNRKKDMILIHALFLAFLMKLEGLKVTPKPSA